MMGIRVFLVQVHLLLLKINLLIIDGIVKQISQMFLIDRMHISINPRAFCLHAFYKGLPILTEYDKLIALRYYPIYLFLFPSKLMSILLSA